MFPFESIITIERTHKNPVYLQIAFAISNAIRNGILKPGAALPGSREMAQKLVVHRKTVLAAYEELIAQDYIKAIPRKGIYVSEQLPLLIPKKWNSERMLNAYGYRLEIPGEHMMQPVKKKDHMAILKLIIDDGYPDVRLSPIDTLLKSYRFILTKKNNIEQSKEDNARGSTRLRDQLALLLSETRGINIGKENILITHGAQMSIYIAAHLLINKNTQVIAGDPGYTTATKVFTDMGATVIRVPVDKYGLDVDAVAQICAHQTIHFLYVIPHHHYPTTVTLTTERRMRLLELAKQYDFVIIEDDYDYDYHYDSAPYLPLASANHEGRVIYIGSFSKILAPSIRIGFMIAPGNFIDHAADFRKSIDVGGDMFMQDALASLIQEGELKRYITKAKKAYHQRRDRLYDLLTKKADSYVSLSLPGGGMAMWIQLDKKIPVRQLHEILLRNGIKIKVLNEELNAFRFGFASLNLTEIEEAIDIIEMAIHKIIS
ncbi:PLP-dependent aminotransferase family protein [Sphingobacterium spiritivorum]|uniref:MocR-like pyridoxine biosynthesis transcription factor PdxR n=1 Tax=Sphingobacterium spiritivorum TaxID=258 RepID=UPI003DA1DC94